MNAALAVLAGVLCAVFAIWGIGFAERGQKGLAVGCGLLALLLLVAVGVTL